jgi:hypothetical protein
MTEREEYELVAKAAGYDFNWMTSYSDGNSYIWSKDGKWVVWNPRTDDGDSRRLQVDLGIVVEVDTSSALAWIQKEHCITESYKLFSYHPDKYAAVRAAVWDVAVEVAKRRMNHD